MEVRGTRSVRRAFVVGCLCLLAAPIVASGHVERASYFPDPAPEKVGKAAVGGKVPKPRSLASALRAKPLGKTRVVCRPDSMIRLRRSVRDALRHGFEIRPTDRRRLSARKAAKLLRINRRLFDRCRYDEIQPAVDDSRNHDRIVVMPGVYTEPTARRRPTNDPACIEHLTSGDPPSRSGALSYRYQFECPNDQNLVAVIGRKPGKTPPPVPPRIDREGIPDLGKCIRCNLQIEGSGVSADDVVVDAGDPRAGSGPSEVSDRDCPAGTDTGSIGCKDVGIRADRADGFVLRNITVRHANEHGIYVIETDGFLLDRFKAFYDGLYGTLTFTSDHGRQSNCDAAGHGDSGVYPGAPPDTAIQRPPGTEMRLNNEVTRCDLHHNLGGYSATNGNAVHVHHNNMYDNALGFNTDAMTAPGHPGFPGDSMLIEHNNFFSNNFDIYGPESDVKAAFPFPMGTGLWIAGGNHHVVRKNRFWDNWRRGTMQFSVPDVLLCGPIANNEQRGCNPGRISTSHQNSYHHNSMGFVPRRFRNPKLKRRLGITAGGPDGRAVQPNGTDFWWDAFVGSQGNCWWANRSSYGEPTSSPPALPGCDGGTNRRSSIGLGSVVNEGELLTCLAAFEFRESGGLDPETALCPWLRPPPRPGSARALRERRRDAIRFRGAFGEFCAADRLLEVCAAAER